MCPVGKIIFIVVVVKRAITILQAQGPMLPMQNDAVLVVIKHEYF